MLTRLLLLHWSRVRVATTLLGVIAFSLPLLMITAGGGPFGDVNRVSSWLALAEGIGAFLPPAAVLVGAGLGLAAWADDQRGGHVYALSLPVSRERYVLYRFVVGGAPLLLPVVGLLAGGVAARAAVTLPAGVHAYPVALAGKWMLAALTCYATFFAIASATRRAVTVTLGVIAGLVVVQLVGIIVGDSGAGFLERVLTVLTTWPFPFAVLTGRWALFDV
jgi:hypothetical protein